ncbi:MAG: hypothetical protein GHCLOJNM_02089 [bacterium]|nr:hypothetical protein [bacterium]
MKPKSPSPHKQTLRLVAITLGVCLASALIAAGPTVGVQTLWDRALGAIGAIGKVLVGVAPGWLNPRPADEAPRQGMLPQGSREIEGERADPKRGSNLDTLQGSGNPGSLGADKPNRQGGQTEPSLTPTPSRIESPTPTWREDATATEAAVTPTPTHPATLTPTARTTQTPTPTAVGRRLALGSAEVHPGEGFQVALSCSDLVNVAGCDFEIGFDPAWVDLRSVQRTGPSDSFLLISKKREGRYSISMAAVEGLPPGPDALLILEGSASSTQTEGTAAPLRFLEAKMYDEMSRAIPVVTQDGMVTILGDGEAASEDPAEENPDATDLSQATAATDPTRVSVEANPTQIGGDLIIGEPTLVPLPIWPVVIGVSPSDSPTPSPTVTPTSQSPADQVIGALLQTDLTKDGVVDSRDLFEFLRYWRQSVGEE